MSGKGGVSEKSVFRPDHPAGGPATRGQPRRRRLQRHAVVAAIEVEEDKAVWIYFGRDCARDASISKRRRLASAVPRISDCFAVGECREHDNGSTPFEPTVVRTIGARERPVTESTDSDPCVVSSFGQRFARKGFDAIIDDAIAPDRLLEKPAKVLAADARRERHNIIERRLAANTGELSDDLIEHRPAYPALERSERQQGLGLERARITG